MYLKSLLLFQYNFLGNLGNNDHEAEHDEHRQLCLNDKKEVVFYIRWIGKPL